MQADGGEAVEVRKHEGLAEGTNEEDGRHGLRGCSEVGELVRMRSKRRRRGAVARRVVGGFQPLGTNRSRRLASSLLRVGERLPPVTALPVGRSDLGAEGSGRHRQESSCASSDTIAPLGRTRMSPWTT